MADSNFLQQIQQRRTFAIISHPDAGKTTITEQLLLHGGAIQQAGTVKARKSARHATSDWMELEKQRGISVSSSVMQFEFKDCIVNLLDTPGHADFSEDTYRTLTAVDSALMVVDAAKGVEERTEKLMNVCRLRTTPVMTLVNKLDRDGRPPLELLDEIERVLKISCAPVTWPIGMGREFRGIYHLLEDCLILYDRNQIHNGAWCERHVQGLFSEQAKQALGAQWDEIAEEIELIRGASHVWDHQAYMHGELSPVFFGSALRNAGVRQLLESFVQFAPAPQARTTLQRDIAADEAKFTGFVFKIQANMDPAHHDRIAFLRICSGVFEPGMRLHQVRTGKPQKTGEALTFMAGDRSRAGAAYPGDIIGLHNHGTIRIGDTFSQGETLAFTGIPDFAPELFRRARLADPLKAKALHKGLAQLCEEGATQLFRPLNNSDVILGAVGVLQFDVVSSRLMNEYKVICSFESVAVQAARWVRGPAAAVTKLKGDASNNLALDHGGELVYLAPTRVNLQLAQERHPDIVFAATRDHVAIEGH